VIFVSCSLLAHAQQKLNVQVSNPKNQPLAGVKITTKLPSTTEITDPAGKATITFTPGSGVVELVIVSPRTLDFISPWQRSVTVPPNSWSLIVAAHGDREMLENPRVVTNLGAKANNLQIRKGVDDPPPNDHTKELAIAAVASEVGLSVGDLENSFASNQAKGDAYQRGTFTLLNREFAQAAILFRKSANETGVSVERSANSFYFLGQSLYELGQYNQSAEAYKKALEFRPNDPTILNNEGLGLSKAGRFRESQDVYQRALEILKDSGQAKSIDFTTTTNNLAALQAYEGQVQNARDLFSTALDLRRQLLPPNDWRIAVSLNNVAAMMIVIGDCDAAEPLLKSALDIQLLTGDPEGPSAYSNSREALVGAPNSIVAMPQVSGSFVTEPSHPDQSGIAAWQKGIAGIPQRPPGSASPDCSSLGSKGRIGAEVPFSAAPSRATTLSNLAMVAACKHDYEGTVQLLNQVLTIQQSSQSVRADSGTTYLGLARAYEGLHKLSEADENYNRAVEVYFQKMGNHPSTAQVMADYAGFLLETGRQDQARDLIRRAIEIDRIALGPDSPVFQDLEKDASCLQLR
jgi:tetratricopeptide (TPR) repeat protein